METTADYTQPADPMRGFIGKAVRGALVAAVVGITTGVLCGVFLPDLGGAFFGEAGTQFFSAFKPQFMALFLGFSSALSAFFASGMDSAIAAFKLSGERRAERLEPQLELTPELLQQQTRTIPVALPAPPTPTHDDASILAKPAAPHIHLASHEIPATSVMEASHAGSLLEAPEIATMRLH